MQQGGRTPSAQAGREEVRESPRQTHRSKKRKSLQGYDEADLEEALLQKRRAGNSREEQISSSMLGQVARGKSPQVYPDSLGGGSVERQRCRREGLCYFCHSRNHMHQQCPLRRRPPFQ